MTTGPSISTQLGLHLPNAKIALDECLLTTNLLQGSVDATDEVAPAAFEVLHHKRGFAYHGAGELGWDGVDGASRGDGRALRGLDVISTCERRSHHHDKPVSQVVCDARQLTSAAAFAQ